MSPRAGYLARICCTAESLSLKCSRGANLSTKPPSMADASKVPWVDGHLISKADGGRVAPMELHTHLPIGLLDRVRELQSRLHYGFYA